MARIYLTGSGPTKGYTTGSGILSNPARILLQERDNRIGSYPTIARTGDSDFTGQYPSVFDDTNTINFVSSDVIYPSLLSGESVWINGGVSTPNVLQGITTQGYEKKGISDVHVTFASDESINPFNESRIYIDDSAFYQTGTDSSILPGFNQRLSSKTVITFDTSPVASTDVHFSTGTIPGISTGVEQGVNSGLAYFNFVNKKWEIIGDLTTGSNVDYYNEDIDTAMSSYLCIVPSTMPQESSDGGLPNNNAYGLPVSTLGFPQASKFAPTGSQLLSFGEKLAGPLLIEKIALDFTGTINLPFFRKIAGLPVQPTIFTFMLMRHVDVSTTGKVSVPVEYLDVDSNPDVVLVKNNEFEKSGYRELIWFGRVGVYLSGSSSNAFTSLQNLQSSYPEIYETADLWIPATQTPINGSFRVEVPSRVTAKTSKISPLIGNRSIDAGVEKGEMYVVGNEVGGANFVNLLNGRNFIRPIVGNEISGSYVYTGGITTNKHTKLSYTSPYVILPNDKFVLAIANQIVPGNTTTETEVASYSVSLEAGSSSITLFGSLLRNNEHVTGETNQPLNSNAVHEDIHYDNPVFDQFDVESTSLFTGSYIDTIVTGSMSADPNAINVRKVQGYIAAGQAGTTGSLQRFVNLISSNDTYYDSLIPDPIEIIRSDGFSTRGSLIIFSDEDKTTNASDDYFWWRSFPFQQKYSNAKRLTSFSVFGKSAYGSTVLRGFAITGSDNLVAEAGAGGLLAVTSSAEEGIKSFFGFSRGYSTAVAIDSGKSSKATIAGFKYGLYNCLQVQSLTRFRRDKYGQFRDLLEQPPNAAYFIDNSVEYPVEVKFFSRPEKSGMGRATTRPDNTHSQNLSPYATSSFPYFDGDVKDRTDDPDVTLVELPAITMS